MTEYKNEYYYIGVDVARNIIIIKPIGFWQSVDLVPDYLPTIFKGIDEDLQADFKVIYELDEMKSSPAEVRDEIHVQGVLQILKRKPSATVVVSPESAIARMQVDFIKKSATDLPAKHVQTREEAIAFLEGREG